MRVGRWRSKIALVLSDLRTLVGVYRGKDLPLFSAPADDQPAAAVLGAQVRRGGKPSATLLARTRHAAQLYTRGAVSAVVPTGGVGEHPPSAAEVMARLLREGGVPREKILLEDRARSTRESARFVAALAREKGIGAVAVVTDPLHCVRAVGAFRAEGLVARAAPVYGSPMWRKRGLRRGQFVREMGAIVWYRARQ